MKIGNNWGKRAGFSLVELLSVVAVVGLLTTVGVGGLGGLRQGGGLTSAGNKIANLVVLARQVAVSENTATAVVVLTKDGLSNDRGGAYRSVAIIKLEDNAWKQVSPWENLPDGVVIDPSASISTFFQNATLPTGLGGDTSPQFNFRGARVGLNDLACRVFLPGGGMLNPDQSPQLRVVEGELAGGATARYRHTAADGLPSNYYDLTLLGVTGQIKVARR